MPAGTPSRALHFDATLVRVHTDSGLVGVGSGDRMLGFEGHEHLFVGQDPLAIERHYRVLSNIDFHYGRCWPLDLALWDLAGKITGAALLEAARRALEPGARLRLLRHAARPGALADAAERYLAQGFPRAEAPLPPRRLARRRPGAGSGARAGRRTARADGRLQPGLADALGHRAALELKDALAVARELERLGVYWMEEPLHRADHDGMRALREATDVRIAGGEMTRELTSCATSSRQAASTCCSRTPRWSAASPACAASPSWPQEHHLIFTPHTWTNGMGVIANAHLVGGPRRRAVPGVPLRPAGVEPGAARLPDGAAAARSTREGWITLSDAPGMGYAPDEERLLATRIG